MAHDMFLKLTDIQGESKDATHPDEIEVLNWSWSIHQESTMHTGSGGGTGKATVRDLVFEHYVDRSSPVLMMNCLKGKHISNALLTIRKVGGGGTPLTYMTISMTDVVVTLVQPQSPTNDDIKVRERVSLSFAKVVTEYTVQNQKGGSAGTVSAGFDIQKNLHI